MNMLMAANEALKIREENEVLRSKLEEWQKFARTVEPMLEEFIEVCKGGKGS